MCHTSDGIGSLLHMVPESYVADIPESKDLHSVERSNQTGMPFHICEANEEDLSCYSSASKRYWLEIKLILKTIGEKELLKQQQYNNLRRCQSFLSSQS